MEAIKAGFEVKNGLRPIETKVLDNFFWSFHHSQGNTALQSLISIHTARQYDLGEVGDLQALEFHMLPVIKRLHVPKEHSDEYNEEDGSISPLDKKAAFEHVAGFNAQWKTLMMVFNRVFYDKPYVQEVGVLRGYEKEVYRANKLSQDEFMAQLTSRMLNIEIVYQRRERKNRKEGSDPHSSHIRMYMFDGKPLQSPELTRLYGDMKEFMSDYGIYAPKNMKKEYGEGWLNEDIINTIRSQFHTVKTFWQLNHPGNQFMPSKSE